MHTAEIWPLAAAKCRGWNQTSRRWARPVTVVVVAGEAQCVDGCAIGDEPADLEVIPLDSIKLEVEAHKREVEALK